MLPRQLAYVTTVFSPTMLSLLSPVLSVTSTGRECLERYAPSRRKFLFQILTVTGLWREDLGIGCHIILSKIKCSDERVVLSSAHGRETMPKVKGVNGKAKF